MEYVAGRVARQAPCARGGEGRARPGSPSRVAILVGRPPRAPAAHEAKNERGEPLEHRSPRRLAAEHPARARRRGAHPRLRRGAGGRAAAHDAGRSGQGQVPYMAPEQLCGEPIAPRRTSMPRPSCCGRRSRATALQGDGGREPRRPGARGQRHASEPGAPCRGGRSARAGGRPARRRRHARPLARDRRPMADGARAGARARDRRGASDGGAGVRLGRDRRRQRSPGASGHRRGHREQQRGRAHRRRPGARDGGLGAEAAERLEDGDRPHCAPSPTWHRGLQSTSTRRRRRLR